MGLREYRRKRDFEVTPEPLGAERAEGGRSFVVQKHAASRLHYDFRLELEGVLKSWAVPKGPSLDPADKRLAMETEDHPVEYGGFEGVIPAGEYGGGTVVVWDQGTWEPVGDPRADSVAARLKFRLHGREAAGRLRARAGQGPRPARRGAQLAPDQGKGRGGAAGLCGRGRGAAQRRVGPHGGGGRARPRPRVALEPGRRRVFPRREAGGRRRSRGRRREPDRAGARRGAGEPAASRVSGRHRAGPRARDAPRPPCPRRRRRSSRRSSRRPRPAMAGCTR